MPVPPPNPHPLLQCAGQSDCIGCVARSDCVFCTATARCVVVASPEADVCVDLYNRSADGVGSGQRPVYSEVRPIDARGDRFARIV